MLMSVIREAHSLIGTLMESWSIGNMAERLKGALRDVGGSTGKLTTSGLVLITS